MYGVWTEHGHADNGNGSALIDDVPESYQISEIKSRLILVGCQEFNSCFVLRKIASSYEEAKKYLEEMNSVSWEQYLLG